MAPHLFGSVAVRPKLAQCWSSTRQSTMRFVWLALPTVKRGKSLPQQKGKTRQGMIAGFGCKPCKSLKPQGVLTKRAEEEAVEEDLDKSDFLFSEQRSAVYTANNFESPQVVRAHWAQTAWTTMSPKTPPPPFRNNKKDVQGAQHVQAMIPTLGQEGTTCWAKSSAASLGCNFSQPPGFATLGCLVWQ